MKLQHSRPWICAQIGSREHYAIPRQLHASGRLRLLLTDFWTPGGKAGPIGGTQAAKIAQRFHPQLADARVEHLGRRRLVFEALARLTRRGTWPTIIARNAWFQRAMVRRLRARYLDELQVEAGIFFSYSYAALDLLRFFRSIGWKTILGQIDPGIREEELMAVERARHPGMAAGAPAPPSRYWEQWREECALCDRIVVNSSWSRDALVEAGIESGKIRVVPLAYEDAGDTMPAKSYPPRFDAARPLRVLYYGQILLRKGAHLALEAARRMREAPVEWHFVGPSALPPPSDLRQLPHVRWSGPIARADAAALFDAADVFLLPTLSDGFALTQLEAQAARLPVIASRFCGSVVRDGENGWLIDPLATDSIVRLIQKLLDDPQKLAAASAASGIAAAFSLQALQEHLLRIEADLYHNPMSD